jgi:hypothetical protein
VRILGSSELRTIEFSTQLQFVNGYQSGWVDFMAPPAALFILFLWTIVSQYYLMSWFVVIGYMLLVLWWLNGNVTKLYVTDTLIVARGSLGRSYQRERRVRTDELKSLTYVATGADGEIPGLYAIHAWTRTCLMPRLTEEEAKAIINTISIKFPHLEQGQLTHMKSVHLEANGEFRPHISHIEIDPVEDARKWKTETVRQMENEDILRYARQQGRAGSEDLESK